MGTNHSVLLVGGTGRTGGRVLTQLLGRGIAVRAIVRSAERLPVGAANDPMLSLVEGDLLSLPTESLQRHLEERDTVISCLGHTLSVRGILGPPFDLVTRAVSNLTAAVHAMHSARPVRFILMNTVAVEKPGQAEKVRGAGQRVCVWVMRVLLPPARDNQRAAEFFALRIGARDPGIEWVAVRPDTLREGDITNYLLHDELVSSIFHPLETNMANVAHFICELTCNDDAWKRWRGQMPVIVNASTTP